MVAIINNRVRTEPTEESVLAHAGVNVGEVPNTLAECVSIATTETTTHNLDCSVAWLTNSPIEATNAIHNTNGDAAADAITTRHVVESHLANLSAATTSTEGGLLATTMSTKDEGGLPTAATSIESGHLVAVMSTEGTGSTATMSTDGSSVGIHNKNSSDKLWLLCTMTARYGCILRDGMSHALTCLHM